MHNLEHLVIGTTRHTSKGDPRGVINFTSLSQLWIHTGTNCNLSCPSCFEMSKPKDARIQAIALADCISPIKHAKSLGARSIGFTGGEPFINPDFMSILEYSLNALPCLVLSNGTTPLLKNLDRIIKISNTSRVHPLTVRISLDYPDEALHDESRGAGSFKLALQSLVRLYEAGINVTIARRLYKDETPDISSNTHKLYQDIFKSNRLPETISIVAFPDLETKESTPEISENCITTYHTPESCAKFMCANTRMLVKKDDKLEFYACTLVDNDNSYNYGPDLNKAIQTPTLLRHKRCFSCFSSGVSCGG